jgi:hypothetical protein
MTPGGIDFKNAAFETRGAGAARAPIFSDAAMNALELDGLSPVIVGIESVEASFFATPPATQPASRP